MLSLAGKKRKLVDAVVTDLPVSSALRKEEGLVSVGEADFVRGEKGHRELVACGGGYAGRLTQAQVEIRT